MNLLWWGQFRYHGMVRHMLSLATELEHQGHHITLYMPGVPARVKNNFNRDRQGNGNLPVKIISEGKELEDAIWKEDFDLIHLHTLDEFTVNPRPTDKDLALQFSYRLKVPLLATLHSYSDHGNFRTIMEWWQELSGIITIDHQLYQLLEHDNRLPPCWYLTEGVDLKAYAPGEPTAQTEGMNSPCPQTDPLSQTGFSPQTRPVLFIGEEGEFSWQTLVYLIKGVGLAKMNLEVVTPQRPPYRIGYHGFPLDLSGILSNADFVFTRGRGVAEAMACGCVTFILGHTYGGPVKTPDSKSLADFSGYRGSSLCYKDIFFDLRRLLENPGQKTQLQNWSQNYAIRNFDQVLVAMQLVDIYNQVI